MMRIKRQRLKKTAFDVSTDKLPISHLEPAENAPPPSSQFEPGPLPPEPDWSEIPFSPPKPETAYDALRSFYEQNSCTALLHPESGLPSYLYGELYDPWHSRMIDAAETFLRENELMLAGLSRGTRLKRVQESQWDDGTYQVTFVQTNKDDVPVYGGHITCNYKSDQLELVISTLHPAQPKIIDSLTWEGTTWLEAKSIALNNLPADVRPVRFKPPTGLRRESQEQGLLVDRWILPFQQPGTKEGIYRPVWRVVIVDEAEEHWLALIDAETQAVLSLEPGRVGGIVQAETYLTALDALNDQPTTVSLDYGNGNSIFTADHVHSDGDRLVEPSNGGSLASLRHLSGTMFHHTRKAQTDFKSLLAGLNFFFAGPADHPNPTDDINVKLEDRAGSASYVFLTHTIHLPKGVTGNPPILAIFEPGYDCEVIVHEFTHALLRYVKPDVFKFKSSMTPIGRLQRKWTGALDEGLAFYFGGVFGLSNRWADYAYQAWETPPPNSIPWRDFRQGPQTPQDAENSHDPASVEHALGMWWARAFWELRDVNQLGPEACNQLLIRAFKSLAGPIHNTQLFAGVLIAQAANSAHQQIIRSVLQSFDADPPST